MCVQEGPAHGAIVVPQWNGRTFLGWDVAANVREEYDDTNLLQID